MRKLSLIFSLASAFVLAQFCPAQTAPAPASVPAFVPANASAQAKRPMIFEDMMRMKRLGDTAVSPDGKWLAYSVTTVNLAQNTKTTQLWIQPIAGGDPNPLAVAQPGDSGVQLLPDDRRILFLSGRSGSEQVWLADFDSATGATSNATKLTSISTGADNALWSPDGHSVLFTSFVYPDCPAITTADAETGDSCNANRDAARAASKVKAQIFTHLLYRHWDHFTGDKRSHLFLVSAGNGGIRDLTPGNPHDVPPFSLEGGGCGCAFSPDSKQLAYTDNIDPVQAISVSAKIFTLDLTNPAAKPLRSAPRPAATSPPPIRPTASTSHGARRPGPGMRATNSGWRFMTAIRKQSRICCRTSTAGWMSSRGRRTRNPSTWLPETPARSPSSRPIWAESLTELPGTGDFSGLLPLANGRAVLADRMTVEAPSEVVAVASASGTPDPEARISIPGTLGTAEFGPITGSQVNQITHLNDALLAQLDRPEMEPFRFTAADGTKLEGFVLRPPGFDAAKKYPVKFLIHGGPEGAWDDSWSYRWNPELFAANGYVVVMVNPRGSTGYGQKIVDGVNGDWGGKPFTDLMTGLDYAEQHYPFIDKSREAALGASYGGYMANWVEGHTDRFKCIVSHDGMFNAESAFGTTEEDWFNIWEFRGHPWDYYGKPDSENPFREWSPSLSAKNFHTPMLVVHGQLDYRLDVSEGFQLFDTLQLLGVPSKMLYFPDEGHWVLKPQNSQLWWKTVNDWVDEWTGKAATSR